MTLFEWEGTAFREHVKEREGFINYLSSVWRSRLDVSTEEILKDDSPESGDPGQQRFFDFTVNDRISARNYVGIVQYEGIKIQVVPKIFQGRTEAENSVWQQNLLFWLSHCRRIQFPFSLSDVSKTPFDDILDSLIFIFAESTRRLVYAQPYQAFMKQEEQLPVLRGSLNVESYVQNNLASGRWNILPCRYQPFVFDNTLNQVIKFVCKLLIRATGIEICLLKLQDILFVLDDVSDVPCTRSDCDKIFLNPVFEGYKQVLDMCRMFLSSETIGISDSDQPRFCLLFPMEYIFEDFLFGFVSSKWPYLKIASQSQIHLATCGQDRVFVLKNDMFISGRLIVDTKYKSRKIDSGRRMGVSSSDMYQMVSYALARNSFEVLLIYPYSPKSINDAVRFTVKSDIVGKEIYFDIVSLDIIFIDFFSVDEVLIDRIRQLGQIFENVSN